MGKLPTAEQFWLDRYFSDSITQKDKEMWLECNNQAKESIEIMIEFTKMHVEAALKEASKEIREHKEPYQVTKNAILLSYPLDNIK